MRSRIFSTVIFVIGSVCLGGAVSSYTTGASGGQPQRPDCCGEVQQLKEHVRQLEDRIRQLEVKLNGDDITLGSGASHIRINNAGVSIGSNGSIAITSSADVSLKAGGTLRLKGTRVTQD